MKIALVIPQPPAYSETFFRSKIMGLIENGHRVILVTGSNSKTFDLCEHLKHPKVYSNPVKQVFAMLNVFISLLPYLTRVNQYIRLERNEGTPPKRILEKIYVNATLLKLKVDWVHFGFATMALERELVPKAIGAKLAVSFRGYDIGVYPLKQPNAYQKLWKYVDKVHSISDDLYQKALKNGLQKATEFEKITPAINTEFFNVKFEQSNSNSPVFLSVGRLHWKKGFIETLLALSQLKLKSYNFTYHIIGSGEDFERIAYAAYELGLANQVKFLGKLSHDAVKTELEKADVYLQYSIQEGFCNAVLEAQAMGKLCVVSNAEGLSENILHEKTGWVVPKLEPQLLAAKIEEVLNLSLEQKAKISSAAQKRVQNEFSLSLQNKKFNTFYTLNQ